MAGTPGVASYCDECDVIIQLTDTEWMSIIDGSRDGLPVCCANVSALRDDIISAARNGGTPLMVETIRRRADWVFPEHGEPPPAVASLLAQCGWTMKTDAEHRAMYEV
jgi:hypothetical protein